MDPALIGFGLGVGILVGMTGIGGGSLMTPMLILVFGVTPVTAVGTDLAYAAVTKTVGGYKHWRQRTVDFELSKWMALGSVPAAVGGVYVLRMFPASPKSTFPATMWASPAAHSSIAAWKTSVPTTRVGTSRNSRISPTAIVGSVPGVWLGSHWSVRVEPAVLRTTLATVLIGAGMALLIKAGLGVPTWVLVPFPLGVVVLLIVTIVREHRTRERRRTQQEAGARASVPEPSVLNP
jgi:uncharacterized membrane protein YfcA